MTPVLTCIDCGEDFKGPRGFYLCRSCWRKRRAATKLNRDPRQLSFADTTEWADATSAYVQYEYNRGRAA